MVSMRKLERNAVANEKAELLFYLVLEKEGKRMLKPMPLKTWVPLAIVKAVLENTIVDRFYETLSSDLRQRGVENGAVVQLRVKFSKSNTLANPVYNGTRILCEITV